MTNDGNLAHVTTNADGSTSVKYKSSRLGKPSATGVLENAKIVIPLKYLSNIFRSLKVPLINCQNSFRVKLD